MRVENQSFAMGSCGRSDRKAGVCFIFVVSDALFHLQVNISHTITCTTAVLLALVSIIIRAGATVEPTGAALGAGYGVVSQNRADLRGLSGHDASASLVCPVCGIAVR
jgi:hypothetical protein